MSGGGGSRTPDDSYQDHAPEDQDDYEDQDYDYHHEDQNYDEF